MRSRTVLWIVSALVLVSVICTAYAVYAQQPPGPPAAPAGGAGAGGGRPGGMRGGMGMMMGGGGGGPVMTVANGKVYVIFMGTLFKFNADTLEEEAQVRLQPNWLPAPGAPGAPPAPPAPAAPAP